MQLSEDLDPTPHLSRDVHLVKQLMEKVLKEQMLTKGRGWYHSVVAHICFSSIHKFYKFKVRWITPFLKGKLTMNMSSICDMLASTLSSICDILGLLLSMKLK